MTRFLLITALLGAALGCGGSAPPPPQHDPAPPPVPATDPDWFEDRTPGSGLDFTHRNGEDADHHTILESLGGGVALFDYDGDGFTDVFATGGGSFEGSNPPKVVGAPNRLFKNLGGWKFRDVTAETGLDHPVFYSHGAAVGDFDNDGWPDLFVTGYGRVALYANRPADRGGPGRVFRDVTAEAGIPPDLPWSTSAAFGDLDGDGFPELFVCQYLDWSFAVHKTCPHHAVTVDVCTPHAFAARRPFLFRNTGKGTFEDASSKHPLRGDGKGLGVVVADLDGNGWPDVYVANDASENHLYLNTAGKLVECAFGRGAAVDETGHENGSMGIAVGDWDRSGRPSLVVTNFQGEWHALYQNVGGGRFQYRSHPGGLAALGQQFVGFGTSLTDFDADGWPDLAITNGHVLRHPTGAGLAQTPVLMRNVAGGGGRKFADATPRGGPYFRAAHRGRGLAVADLDNDGWPDVVVSHVNAPVALLRNRSGESIGTDNHGVRLVLKGKANRSTVGATVALAAEGVTRTGFAFSGGYLSSHADGVHFGLGAATRVDRISVAWPGGARQEWPGPLAADRTWTLTEGQPDAE